MVEDVLTAADCSDDAATKCTYPVVIEYTGLSSQAYGCGECDAAASETCADCVGTADTACNTKVEVITFKCFNYTYSEADSKWTVGESAGECTAAAGTDIKCNK